MYIFVLIGILIVYRWLIMEKINSKNYHCLQWAWPWTPCLHLHLSFSVHFPGFYWDKAWVFSCFRDDSSTKTLIFKSFNAPFSSFRVSFWFITFYRWHFVICGWDRFFLVPKHGPFCCWDGPVHDLRWLWSRDGWFFSWGRCCLRWRCVCRFRLRRGFCWQLGVCCRGLRWLSGCE